ncbi:MAG TPA: GNAT family N-acetyltransferase, partial [Allosphingosinicella sp.]
MTIETGRLILRDWSEADIEPFIRHLNVEPVMRWLGGVRTVEQQRAVVRERFMAWQEERGFTFWAVERKSDGELLGFCGLKIADDADSPIEGEYEVGWRLREDAWGQGYAKEAAIASLDFAFERLGAERVVALTVEGNAPSWGLMLRLGMERRADLDYDTA